MTAVNGWFPRLNADGDIASGNSGIWITPRSGSAAALVSPVGIGPIWAGATLIFNLNDGKRTQVGSTQVDAAYNDYAGSDDDRWAGFLAPASGRVDVYRGTVLAQSIPTACRPRFAAGMFGYLQPYQSEQRELFVNGRVVASGAIMDFVIDPSGRFIVYQIATGTYTRALYYLQQDSVAELVSIRNDEAPLGAFIGPDGEPWIVTGTNDAGTFVRPVKSSIGYRIIGDLYYPDSRMIGGRLRVVGSYSNGVPRFDEWIDFSSARIDLNPQTPIVPVTFAPFNHPVLIAVFKDPDNESGAAAEIVVNKTGQSTSRQCFVAEDSLEGVRGPVLGIYSESSTAPSTALELAASKNTRLLLCHDSPADWTLPAGLRPWDLPCLELYRYQGEALDVARNRWSRQLQQLLTDWPGDVAVAAQFYCMGGAPGNELWSVAEVLDVLRPLSDLVNLSSRIKVVAPFSWRRANGITGHQELRDAFASLLRATPGQPTLKAVEGSDMPVRPVITVKGFAQQLRPNQAATIVDMVVGDTKITVRLDAGSNLFVDASNAAGLERTGVTNRHVDIGDGDVVVPPEPVDVVTFYSDINYQGKSWAFAANASTIDVDRNDQISSIRVPAGKTVTVFQDRDYGGQSLKLSADAPDLRKFPGPGTDGTWNDAISSIKLTDDVVIDPPKPEPDTTSFRTINGHLLSVENGVVVAKRTDGDGSEQFSVEHVDDDIALKGSNGKYVSAEDGGGRELTVNRTAVGSWERFKPQRVPGGNAVALETANGVFVSPQDGGGSSVLANGPSIGAWEPLLPSRSIWPNSGRVGSGPVRANGRLFVDDVGSFTDYGTSLFWGLWAMNADLAKLDRNLAKVQAIGCGYTRDLGEVGGVSWEDRVINPDDADYRDRLARYLDRKMERFNLRTGLTIFGGGSGADPNRALDKVIDAIRGREAAIIWAEIANEAFKNFTDRDLLRRLVSKLRSAFPSMLVASSSPDGPWTRESMDLDIANFYTIHPERQQSDEDWREVRQPVDSPDVNVPGDDNEPIGLQSSVAMLSDPLRLAMIRAVGLTSGVPGFIIHTGAGVRGGGAADLATGKFYLPRKANLDEYPELDAVASAVRNVGTIIPVDATNWRKVKGHWADSPLYADKIWSDDPANTDHGCVRVYGSYTGNAYAENVIGIRRYVLLTQHGGGAHVRAINPLTLEVAFEKDVADGETFRLEGDQDGGSDSAYIVLGTR